MKHDNFDTEQTTATYAALAKCVQILGEGNLIEVFQKHGLKLIKFLAFGARLSDKEIL